MEQSEIEPIPVSVGRNALLRATIAVGLAEGLSGVTSRSVAEAAGVAHSLVRYHFGSIESLVTEALGLAIDEGVELGQRLAAAKTLAEFTESLEASITEHRDTHAFLYEALLESRRRPELYPQVERYFREYRGAISEQLADLGIDDQGLIDVIYFALEGMTFKEVAYPDQLGTRGAIVWLQRLVAERTGVPLGEGPAVEELTAEGAGAPGAPSDDTPSDAAPSDAASSDAAPSDAAPSDAASSDDAPSDAAPSDAAPSDDAPRGAHGPTVGT